MAKDTSHDLADVAAAVRGQRLAAADLKLLRLTIAGLEAARSEHNFVKVALRNLKIAGTQLETIAARSDGRPIDEKTFAALPAHIRKRILARLDNIASRMRTEAAKSRAPEYHDPAFKCVRDYENCRRETTASVFWCQLSMIVCLLRTVLPALARARAK